jgi:hypothetical protein
MAFELLIACEWYLQEFENLLLRVSKICGKDDGVLPRLDLVSFNVSEESYDVKDGRSGARAAFWIDRNGSEFLPLHGAAKCPLDQGGHHQW